MRIRAVLILTLCASLEMLATECLAAGGACPQQLTGSIRGTVVNSVGSLLPGIGIQATGASGDEYRALTDRAGAFVLDGLPPGLYSVETVATGVKRAVADRVRVNAGRAAAVRFLLAPDAAGEASRAILAPGVEATSVDDRTIFAADLIDRLPTGREALSLVPMAPGISVDTPYAGLAFRGASAAENRYFIDGFDLTNLFSGGAAFTLPTDVVEQVDVRSGGLDLGFTVATGALVSIVTPVSGRRWRGSAAVHFTNDALSNEVTPTGSNDAFSTWEPAITAGGPLAGSSLSLFASYTPRFTSATRTMEVVDAQGGVSHGSFASSSRTQLSADNLTGRVGASGRFRVSAIFGRTRREGTLPPASASPLASGFDWSALTRSRPFGAVSGTVDALVSRVAVSFQGGYSRTDALDYGVPEIVYRTANAPGPTMPPDVAAALNAVRAASAPIPTNAAVDRDVQQHANGRVALGFAANALGRHEARVGGQFDDISNDVLAGSFGPVVVINATSGVPPYGTYQASTWLLSGTAHSTRIGIFADDTWRVSSRLTIRAGVRAESQTIPPYSSSMPDPASPGRTISLGTTTLRLSDALSPRVGAAWDARGDGRWIVSGTWGVTHDPVQLDLARYYLGGDVRWQGTYTLDTLDFATIGYVGCLNPAQCAILYPGNAISSSFYSALRSVGARLKPTAGQDLSVGVDHALGGTATLGVRYIRRRLLRVLDDVGYFPAGASTPALELIDIGDSAVSLGSGLPDAPQPRRDYDAVEARLSKRFAHGWRVDAVYTYSRLTGNYTAFFAAPGTPTAPSQYPPLKEDAWFYTSSYNSPYGLFDAHATPVYGPLDLDRPHVVKAELYAGLPAGLQAGVYQVVASGSPIARWVSVGGQAVYYEGRLSDGRTPVYSQTDVQVQRAFTLGARLRLVAALNVLNLFDQQATIAVDGFEGTLPPLTPAQFFAGFDAHGLMSDTNPSFLQPSVEQPGRAIRLDVRVTF
ncbi:MAG: carboxypeptidase regulatory-like domain-containing protein [Bacteroidales bacterium]